jgi:hypothetical protein
VDDVVVRIEHVRACGMCCHGTKAWFEARGLDFRAFLKDGAPASEVEALGDGLALKAVAKAREEAHGRT